MKKVSLSKMKCAALFAMMFFSYQGMAQNASLYIGDNCKIYRILTSKNEWDMQVAHLVTDEQNPSVKYPMADKITLIRAKIGSEMITNIKTSEYGNYVEFYDVVENCFKIFESRFHIAKNGSCLYLVHHVSFIEEYGYTITTDLEIADDFQIIYYHKDASETGDKIYIKNNGILSRYTFDDIKNNTSVNSPKVDDREDATYSIDGKKVQTPHNGIFVKGDKKVIIK